MENSSLLFQDESGSGDENIGIAYTKNITLGKRAANYEDSQLDSDAYAKIWKPETDPIEDDDESKSTTEENDNDDHEPLRANMQRETVLMADEDNYIDFNSDDECRSTKTLQCKRKLVVESDYDDDGEKDSNSVPNRNTDNSKRKYRPKKRCETDSKNDDNSDNTNNDDENYETESENSVDEEPEAKGACSVLLELNTKSFNFIYRDFVVRQCPMCEFEFNSAHCWKKHINFMHHLEKPEQLQFKYNKQGAKCKLCTFQTATPRFSKLLDHEITHMPNSHYLKCKLCDWKTKTHTSMNFHLRSQHAETIDVETKSEELRFCMYCQEEFSSQWYLRRHMIQEHEKEISDRTFFKCLECGQEFNSNASLRAHVYEKFEKNTPQELGFELMPAEGEKSAYLKCLQCTQTFRLIERRATKINLREHYMLHLGEASGTNAYKCKYCSISFRRYYNMRMHICKKLGEALENHVGDISADSSQDGLEKSEDAKPKSPFERATSKREYMKNIRHVCLKCGIPSGQMFFCKRHMFSIHGMGKAPGLDFKKISPQDSTEIYECTVCEEFTCDFDLNTMLVHARSHTEYDPFQCNLCQKTFTCETDIPGHYCVDDKDANIANETRQSNEEKSPFERATFKRESMKNIRHICLKCGISFSRMYVCKRHMFSVHGMNKASGLNFKKIGNENSTEIYECTVCKEFTCDFDLNTMLVHASSHTVYDPFRCKLCQKTFTCETDIPGHYCVDDNNANIANETHQSNEGMLTNMEILCPKCGQTYSKNSTLTRHMHRVHAMNKPHGLGFSAFVRVVGAITIYSCTACADFTAVEEDMKAMFEHALKHMPYKRYRCTLCSELFQLTEEVKQHRCTQLPAILKSTPVAVTFAKSENKIRLNKMGGICPKCGKRFAKTFVCKVHMTNIHGMDTPSGLGFVIMETSDVLQNIYRCTQCTNYTLDQPDVSTMLVHAREHFPFDGFWCKLCEQSFRLKTEASNHRCDDAGEMKNSSQAKCAKSFEKCMRKLCPECNNEMPSVKTWRWHMIKYHEFNTLEGLKMAQTNANLLECRICQMHITHKRRYEHRFLHLPYKPYQCKFCNELFIEMDRAKQHCNECKLVPAELPERNEKKKETPVKQKPGNSANSLKVYNEHEKSSDEVDYEFSSTKETRKPQSRSKQGQLKKQKSENETSNKTKGISVVLTDDNDYAKFVRISCPLCPDTEFETSAALAAHFDEEHNNFKEHFIIHNTNAANCKACNKYFKFVYNNALVRHYLGEINATCYCCRQCDKNFLYFKTMRRHLFNEHEAIIAGKSQSSLTNATVTAGSSSTIVRDGGADPLTVTSIDISKVSRTTMAIRTHKTAVFNEFNAYIAYACPECNEPFETSEQWHLHINGQHDFFDQQQLNIEATADGYKRCKQCNVNISGGILAEQRHKLTHMKHKSFICTLCLHRSTTLGVLTQHFRRRHFAKGAFKCPLCTCILSTSCEQIEHIKNEHDESEYPHTLCRVCFSNFSSLKGLQVHKELHNPNRVVFQCKYCERSYKVERDMILHIRAKHPGQEEPTDESE